MDRVQTKRGWDEQVHNIREGGKNRIQKIQEIAQN